jgi:hypothetical protein
MSRESGVEKGLEEFVAPWDWNRLAHDSRLLTLDS